MLPGRAGFDFFYFLKIADIKKKNHTLKWPTLELDNVIWQEKTRHKWKNALNLHQ